MALKEEDRRPILI